MDSHREQPHRDDRHRDDALGADHLVLHGEQVEVRTERVLTGRVTLRKQVVTEEKSVPVTLRHERLEVIEETFDEPQAVTGDAYTRDAAPTGRDGAVDGSADAELRGDVRDAALRDDELRDGPRTDLRTLDDGDLEITLYAERPVVSVEVVPVERIRVRRGVVTERRSLRVDVDREEAYLDHESAPDRDHRRER